MKSYYETTYQRRLNRYGLNYQSRIQNQRERDFNQYLYKTIYRVDFEFDGDLVPASLEHSKQDYSETQAYLLTRLDVKIPNGTVLMIQSSTDERITPWMVWWLEYAENAGYNTYIVLKMTHYLTWKNGEQEISQWAYFRGPGAKSISDSTRSSTGKPVYNENNNLHTFITTENGSIHKDLYFEITQGTTTQGYVVTDLDINSTPGISYVTVDPVPVRPAATSVTQTDKDAKEDFYWLNGGTN